MIKNIKKTNTKYTNTLIFKNRRELTRGYTLVEVIFYVVLFAILSIVLLDVMITMTGLFMKTMINRDIMQGSTIMENISRELKQANDFSFASNTLTLNTEDSYGNPKTITYSFSNPNMQINDSVLGNLGNLNTPNVSITNFNVITINTLKGKAAKLDLVIKSNRDSESRTENFENTLILRGSY
jgi:hypothetical protein